MFTVDQSPIFRPTNAPSFNKPPPENAPDHFDRLPEPVILTILNYISDIKTLIRCRAVSRRFNSLVPQSESLLLRVDSVISAVDSDNDHDKSSLIGFIKSIVKSIQDLFSINHSIRISRDSGSVSNSVQSEYSPAMILRSFERIKLLRIELPAGDLWLEKRAAIKWTAEFGKSLKSCVILGFRCGGAGESDLGGGGGLKTRVVWTISALIAASARHFMVRDIVKDNLHLKKLTVTDREDEGCVIINESGIKEYREDKGEIYDEREGQNGNFTQEGQNGNFTLEGQNGNFNGGGVWWRGSRTRVPAVWMRMRHEAKLELSNGVTMEGATLVVVRPTGNTTVEEAEEDCRLVAAGWGFEGIYGEAVAKLIKRRSYLLEMNSF